MSDLADAAGDAWQPIRAQLHALYADLGLKPAPLAVDHLVALIQARAEPPGPGAGQAP